MPLYEYRTPCGKKVEAYKPTYESQIALVQPCDCIEKGSCKARRILSPVPTTFKFADTRSQKC